MVTQLPKTTAETIEGELCAICDEPVAIDGLGCAPRACSHWPHGGRPEHLLRYQAMGYPASNTTTAQ